MSNPYLMPAAVVAAGALTGLGLYFGLAAREAPPEPTPTAIGPPSAATVAEGPIPEPSPAVVASTPPSSTVPTVDVTEAAKEALASIKPKLVETCWKPAIADNPEPSKARWTFDVTFDTSGKEIARGISDVRGMERPDVASCLRQQPLDLTIPPPSKNTRVELELTLP